MAAETPSSRLLESSRSLAFLIQDATDLPPVSRSIHQIAEQSERMLSGAPTAVQPGAATYRFLASQGVDAMDLDPSVLDLYRGSGAPAASLGSVPLGTVEELEAFIAGEQRQMLQPQPYPPASSSSSPVLLHASRSCPRQAYQWCGISLELAGSAP